LLIFYKDKGLENKNAVEIIHGILKY
jgi:hypothetical protein